MWSFLWHFFWFSSLQFCYWLNKVCQNNLVIVFSFFMGEQIKIYIYEQIMSGFLLYHDCVSPSQWTYGLVLMRAINRTWLLKFTQRNLFGMSTAMSRNADLGTCIRFHSFVLWQQQQPDDKMNLQSHHFMVYESKRHCKHYHLFFFNFPVWLVWLMGAPLIFTLFLTIYFCYAGALLSASRPAEMLLCVIWGSRYTAIA